MAESPRSDSGPTQVVEIEVNLDGVRRSLEVRPDDSLLRALRQAGHTETAGACEQGECGSCSVRIDGDIVCSCLIPAVVCDQSDIDTVASLASPAIVEALVAHGAVQCGFCTPGFVVTLAGLLDEPLGESEGPLSDNEIRERLAGNLCRCTGYEGLVAATRTLDRARRDDGETGAIP